MMGVKSVTVTELDKRATALAAEAEQTKTKIIIIITKRGKLVALLNKITDNDRGKEETVRT